MITKFQPENMTDYLTDIYLDWRMILKLKWKMWDESLWTELNYLRIRTSDGILWMESRTFAFHKRRRLADQLLTFQEGLCSVGLLTYLVSQRGAHSPETINVENSTLKVMCQNILYSSSSVTLPYVSSLQCVYSVPFQGSYVSVLYTKTVTRDVR
jgi:hypothetical protein